MRQYGLGELTTEGLQRFVKGQVQLLCNMHGVGYLIRRGEIKTIAVNGVTLVIELEWMAQNIGDTQYRGVHWVFVPVVRFEFSLETFRAADLGSGDPKIRASRVLLENPQTNEIAMLHPLGDSDWVNRDTISSAA